MKKFFTFLFFLALPFLLSLIIQLILPSYKDFYLSLNKPFNLPTIVFPIVWSIIYLIIGSVSYFIYKEKGNNKELKVYFLQLFFNITWTLLFFGFQNIGLTVLWTIILLIIVLVNSYMFYKVKKLYGLLFLPYIMWTMFATYLIFYIYLNN